jgi:hypothetical protein
MKRGAKQRVWQVYLKKQPPGEFTGRLLFIGRALEKFQTQRNDYRGPEIPPCSPPRANIVKSCDALRARF